MFQHMKSPTEAFKMFDSAGTKLLTYLDFDRLVRELSRLSSETCPCYTVIKDLFDFIDAKKDQVVDDQEWRDAFGNIETDDRKLVIKNTPLLQWESSLEAEQIATCIARNRNVLKQRFKEYSTHSDHNGVAKYVTWDQAKRALKLVLDSNFKGTIVDAKIQALL